MVTCFGEDIQVADKKALENYGRPHVDGRPTGHPGCVMCATHDVLIV